MRNPKRIKRICNLIEKLWKEVPDQRLGQFLSNYAYGHHVDIFYIEDDDLEKNLLKLLEEMK